jgi:hypothetical protein
LSLKLPFLDIFIVFFYLVGVAYGVETPLYAVTDSLYAVEL